MLMSSKVKILVLEDNSNDADLLYRELKKSDFEFVIETVITREEFENALQDFNPDIVLSDYSLPSFDARTAFRIKQNNNPHIPFIIVSGIIGEELAVELIKEGVTDYAPKNKLFTLNQKIARALKDNEERKEKIVISDKLALQAAELNIVNNELVMQNQKMEMQTTELLSVNKELLKFTYIASHDLQEPLRKIQMLVGRLLENENDNLSENGKDMFNRIRDASERMQSLIQDLIAFSRLSHSEELFEYTNLKEIIEQVIEEFNAVIEEEHAIIEINLMCDLNIIPFQFHQLMQNLISNSIKFAQLRIPPHIIIESYIAKGINLNNTNLSPSENYCHISICDNGIGFEEEHNERIFEVFQRLHSSEKYRGTGIGLAIVKKIVENHNGIITATSQLGIGTQFDIYIPTL